MKSKNLVSLAVSAMTMLILATACLKNSEKSSALSPENARSAEPALVCEVNVIANVVAEMPKEQPPPGAANSSNQFAPGLNNDLSGIIITDASGTEMEQDRLDIIDADFLELGTGVGQVASSNHIIIKNSDLQLMRGSEVLVHLNGPTVLSSRESFPLKSWEVVSSKQQVIFHFQACRASPLPEQQPPKLEQAPITMPESFQRGFRYIPPGSFTMGSPDGSNGEIPHKVTLTRSFEMQATHVTQEQWVAIMGHNPSYFKKLNNCPENHVAGPVTMCPQHPVDQISFSDTQSFVRKLNETLHDGYTYRLPTEAEWEYAARAGTYTTYSSGENTTDVGQYAWYRDNSIGQTQDVAKLQPNAWGLFDMTGNLWQWVQDWYGEYPSQDAVDPVGPSTGTFRMIRGGSWYHPAIRLRLATHVAMNPVPAYYDMGFRLVRTR